MTARQQWIFVGAVVAIVGLALSVGAWVMRDELFPVDVGSTAPAWAAKTVHAKPVTRTSADYRGKVVVLNIWATWCAPCVVEMPTFEQLKKAVPDTNLAIVAVSIDDFVGADSVARFAKNLGLTFDVLHDPDHHIDRDYLTTGYPETFVIAKDGTIRKKWIGPADWASESNVALIRELLGLPQAPATEGARADSAKSVQLKRQ